MARPRKNANDPRSRYTHQAYDVTYGGISPERGPSGRDSLLAATYQASFMFTAPADVATEQVVGDLPYGVYITGFINHEALTTGTFLLTLKGVGGGPDVELIAALTGDLTAEGPITLDTPVWMPITQSRPVTITITGGTAGEVATCSLLATPAETAWK